MDNEFRENDYGFNEYENDFSNELNADSKLVDIRIILTNLDYLEFISKAVSNFDLSNFNVNISSIIPTRDIKIAENTIVGADLVLIATESNAEGHKLYQSLKKALKNDLNLIEYLKLPSLEELNDYEYDYNDENIFEDEIANSIIRGGLYSISNLSSINNSKRKYMEIKKDFEEESIKHEKTSTENDLLIKESKAIRERGEKLSEEVKILQRELDKIKSDYSDLKSRFEGIHSKNSLEVYSLNDLWYDLFNEHLSQDVYKFILISTDNFRPKNLMIGQGAICAESKEDALDWLKIIKTAFILADTNKQDLDYNNFKSNFKFEDIEEFGVSDSTSDSISSSRDSLFDDFPSFGLNDSSSEESIFTSEEKLPDSSDDGFIYNERFEGHGEDSKSLDDIFKEKLNIKENEESINVFNLKSLKSIENEDYEEEEDSLDEEINRYIDNDDDEDYDYDEEDSEYDENEEESEDYSPFSNFWGE